MLPILLGTVICAAMGSGALDHQRSADRDTVRYWDLPTGSHLAYVRISASRTASLPPVLYLHGGPGAYEVASVSEYRPLAERWARLGFDVYLYDQVGSGRSGRLHDPVQYTVARHVADLEAIRVTLGAQRLILIGESWGAALGAQYMARYPDRVARAVFVSPGAIDLSGSVHSPTPRFDEEMLAWVRTHRSTEEYRRCQIVDALMARDIHRAYERVGDATLDALFDAWVTEAILGRTVHDSSLVRGARMAGMGWWVWTVTNWDQRAHAPPIRSALHGYSGPVLVLHGTSDYLPDSLAIEYATIFQRARLVQVPQAGHLLWVDQPEVFAREIGRFLAQEAGAT